MSSTAKNIVIIENNVISTISMRKRLTLELMKQGHRVLVLTTGHEKDMAKARELGIQVKDVGSCNTNPIDVIAYMRRLKTAISNHQADICLTFTIRPAIWGNWVTSGLKVPTITNITGIGPLFSSNSPAYLIARTLYRFVLKKTGRIFFQNRDDMDAFLKSGFISPERAALIPGSGVDHEYFKPMPRPQEEKKFIFLYIGRLLKDKGVVEFVEAARMLKDNERVEFRIVGPLWHQNLKKNTVTEETLQSWIDEKSIVYCGPSEDVRMQIAAADCVVLPSYREGLSNVLLEASSMERPSITCDTTGCREIVEHGVNGYLCKVADSADLAEKMKSMMTLPSHEREAMGNKARAKVIKEYDKRLVMEAYFKAIAELSTNS